MTSTNYSRKITEPELVNETFLKSLVALKKESVYKWLFRNVYTICVNGCSAGPEFV